jgi:lipid II:glycine glycyltransferase (peptidoglycan interpeptide bridge formation enzyme)
MKPTNPFEIKKFANFQLKSGKASKIHTLKNKKGVAFYAYQLPLFKKYSIIYTTDYSPALKKIANKENIVYTLIESYSEIKTPKNIPIGKTIKSIIPRHTLAIDLTQPLDEILKKMHPKGRYNIRLATKRGIEIKESNDIETFYKLLLETKDRDKFYVNSFEYYKTMFKSLGTNAKLYLAYYKNDPIAGILNTYFKNTATYYYGASSNTHRNLMAPYLLQWHAINEAKNSGFEIYDFLGIADPKNKKDPLSGVTYFKQKFSGDYLKWPEGITIVHNKLIFWAIKIRRYLT